MTRVRYKENGKRYLSRADKRRLNALNRKPKISRLEYDSDKEKEGNA